MRKNIPIYMFIYCFGLFWLGTACSSYSSNTTTPASPSQLENRVFANGIPPPFEIMILWSFGSILTGVAGCYLEDNDKNDRRLKKCCNYVIGLTIVVTSILYSTLIIVVIVIMCYGFLWTRAHSEQSLSHGYLWGTPISMVPRDSIPTATPVPADEETGETKPTPASVGQEAAVIL